jgi:thioredoxin reductase (NADPH)
LNRRTGTTEELATAGAFVFIGLDPNTTFLQKSRILQDQWGFIVTGHSLVHAGARPAGYEVRDPALLESSVPGIFAAGDVRAESTKQVASAAGEGAAAALMVRDYLKTV